MSKCSVGSCGCSAVPQPSGESSPDALHAKLYRIDSADCPTDAALIRNNLEPLDGVTGLDPVQTGRTLDVSDRPHSPASVDAVLPAAGGSAQRIDVTGAPLRTTLTIAGMDCPTEEALIRNALAGMPGVAALDFNLMQRRLSVTHRPGAIGRAHV